MRKVWERRMLGEHCEDMKVLAEVQTLQSWVGDNCQLKVHIIIIINMVINTIINMVSASSSTWLSTSSSTSSSLQPNTNLFQPNTISFTFFINCIISFKTLSKTSFSLYVQSHLRFVPCSIFDGGGQGVCQWKNAMQLIPNFTLTHCAPSLLFLQFLTCLWIEDPTFFSGYFKRLSFHGVWLRAGLG